jgi:hypothetical protein
MAELRDLTRRVQLGFYEDQSNCANGCENADARED